MSSDERNAPFLTRIRAGFDRNYFIIFLFALIGHGLLLLNDGIYWDDWIYSSQLAAKQYTLVQTAFDQSGIPLTGYLHQFLGSLPNFVSVYKILIFVLVTLTAVLIYKIFKSAGFVSPVDSLWVVLLALANPISKTRGTLIMTPRDLWIFLFFLGFYLSLQLKRISGATQGILRVAALGCFYVSFMENILLPLYAGFLIFFIYTDFYRKRASQQSLRQFLFRHADFLILPIVFWIVKQTFFVPYGLYAGYGGLHLSIGALSSNFAYFLTDAVATQLVDLVLVVTRNPLFWLLIVLMIGWLYLIRRDSQRYRDQFCTKRGMLLVFGALWWILAAAPSVATGTLPTSDFWTTRHFLLLPLPTAMILVSILPRNGKIRGNIAFIMLVGLLLAFNLSTITTYIGFQARWIKDRSVMEDLRANASASRYSVYLIGDEVPATIQESRRFYEWSNLFKRVWGDESRIGIDLRLRPDVDQFLAASRPYYSEIYALSAFDPQGCRALLTLRPKHSYQEFELSALYWKYRFFDPAHLNDFLSSLTDIQVEPIPAAQAVHCNIF